MVALVAVLTSAALKLLAPGLVVELCWVLRHSDLEQGVPMPLWGRERNSGCLGSWSYAGPALKDRASSV